MKHYTIRKAKEGDLPRILTIYAQARQFMRDNGNSSQWSGGYPQEELLRQDMEKDALHVVAEDDTIRGVFYFAIEEDPTYARIDHGSWYSHEPYGVIHRIAADGSGGIFAAALQFAARQNRHIRIDTHHDNKPMQHVVEKHGFQKRGIIYVADGSPRIAYEKI